MAETNNRKLVYMILLFLAAVLLSLSIGRYWISPITIVKIFLSRFLSITPTWEQQAETVLFQIRIPRVVLGALIGAGLSTAGAVYQGIFRNPMVSPDILGASWGAGFGAALGLLLSLNYAGVTALSFLFGIGAVAVVCLIGKIVKNNQQLSLVLAGIMVGSVFSSGVSFLKLVADPLNTLPAITYWLMGSLTTAKAVDIWFAGPLILLGIIPIFLLRWRINAMTLSDDEAHSIGVNTRRMRWILIISATLITAASVSVSGMIGWVGLVIPHFVRMLLGGDYKKIIPGSMFLGAAYLILVDDIAKSLTTSEIPIGILTSVIGAPFFLYLIGLKGRMKG